MFLEVLRDSLTTPSWQPKEAVPQLPLQDAPEAVGWAPFL